MVFSSITFIYFFLSILLLVYFLAPKKYKNIVLLLFSLLFYFYGEADYLWLLILSCLINYTFAILIDKTNKINLKKILLTLCVISNVSLFIYFKYTDFLITNINSIFSTNFSLLHIALPLGISFFTFQALSYVIDVYKRKVNVEKNILSFATYICLFPQLVAGPIVRYETIHNELNNRETSFDKFSYGIKRFIIGLSKKVLIANTLGVLSTTLFDVINPSITTYWLNAVAFTLQIYFDFSGYSDMAIGLGSMFGFKFLENFNYPFISSSITDFWRRWHISLSSWLKDYIYIPLGGSRVSKPKYIRNILIVWLITGLWHGASWNFCIWGLFFAVILLIEKIFLKKYLDKHKVISHIYTLFIILISFIIFNSNNILEIFTYLKSMFGFNNLPLITNETLYFFRSYIVILLISIISSTPLIKNIYNKYKDNKIIKILEPFILIIILLVVTAFLIDSSFNPFLYFRF
ncbi:MAG: MBOAT family O-acyltransferase [Bacilli bacterium]